MRNADHPATTEALRQRADIVNAALTEVGYGHLAVSVQPADPDDPQLVVYVNGKGSSGANGLGMPRDVLERTRPVELAEAEATRAAITKAYALVGLDEWGFDV